jgi:galactokinase/NDP-sugar pyrophosphorylase family protein
MNVSDIKFALSNFVTAENSELARKAARLTTLCNLFLDHFGDGPASLLRAPARMGVLGEHIDYVSYLPTASLTFGSRERDAWMLYRKSPEPTVRCVSSSAKFAPSSFSIHSVPEFEGEIEAQWLDFLFTYGIPAPHWKNYLNAAVTFARGKFGKQIQNGFDLVLDSNIPPGGGASSSSALVVLAGAAIRNVNEIAWTSEELASDCAIAEWFIGTRGGSMDHLTICLAETANAVLIDYASHETRLVPLPDEPFAWVTFFTKPADKGREIMIEYNERAAVSRLLIPAIIDSWKLTAPARYSAWLETRRSLAGGSMEAFEEAHDLFTSLPATISIDTVSADHADTFHELEKSFPALVADKPRWPLKIRVRGMHHLGEAKRVALATNKLDLIQHDRNSGDTLSAMQTLGKLLNESHASLRDLYEVSVPEVEDLIKIVREDPHVLGARVMGGGFGGNVLALTTRDHSAGLINRVQEQYYSARSRDGVNEGSVIVSTPGRGLTDIDLDDLWRDSIAQINVPRSNTAAHVKNLRVLIDTASIKFDPQEIQPVIVAAGKGSRAANSGLNVPKPVAIVAGQPAIVHVLRSIRDGLGATRAPVVIVSPDTEAAIRYALRGEDVRLVIQPHALGTGDAVLNAHRLMSDFTGMSLVVWSTQPVIRPKTFARTAKLARLFDSYDMVLPTALAARPYAPLQRNASGEIEFATETHLENAETAEFGETNIGMFILKNQTMFQVLLELRSRYWDESAGRYNRSRGELGFPNEVINALASRKPRVFASPFADAREEQGIKHVEDLSRCERFLSELNDEEQAETSQPKRWRRP